MLNLSYFKRQEVKNLEQLADGWRTEQSRHVI